MRTAVTRAACVAAALCLSVPAHAEGQRRLFVPPLDAKPGASAERVAALEGFLVSELRRLPGVSVVTLADVQQVLSLEQQKQLSGCSESSCLAELAGALDADEILHGSVGRLGSRELVLTLSRVDPRTARALAGESERLAADDVDAMLDSAARALQRLYPGYDLPEPRVKGFSRWRTGAVMAAVGSALQYAAVASSLFSMSSFFFLGVVGGIPVTVPAVLAVLASPVLVAWTQAWLMDLLGRRQAGFRKAAAVGVVLVPVILLVSVPLVVGAAILGSSSGTVVGVAAGGIIAFSLGANSVTNAWLGGAFAGALALLQVAGGGLLCAGLAAVPALVLVSVGVPALQAVLTWWGSVPRPPGEEARVPGLFAPDEQPWPLPAFLPAWLVGGRMAEQVVAAPTPAAPAAPPTTENPSAPATTDPEPATPQQAAPN